jgi:hypothetical protein
MIMPKVQNKKGTAFYFVSLYFAKSTPVLSQRATLELERAAPGVKRNLIAK